MLNPNQKSKRISFWQKIANLSLPPDMIQEKWNHTQLFPQETANESIEHLQFVQAFEIRLMDSTNLFKISMSNLLTSSGSGSV